jgi:hypothetical protein
VHVRRQYEHLSLFGWPLQHTHRRVGPFVLYKSSARAKLDAYISAAGHNTCSCVHS